MAAFQNVSIKVCMQFYYCIQTMQICKITKQCLNYESNAGLLVDCVKNAHCQRFKIEYIVYILYSGIM